jgi:hypothetical protein
MHHFDVFTYCDILSEAYCKYKAMNKNGNLASVIIKTLSFGARTVFQGSQNLFISVSVVMFVIFLEIKFFIYLGIYGNHSTVLFYQTLLNAFSVSIFLIAQIFCKRLNQYNRKIIFAFISYTYLLSVIAPHNVNGLYKVLSSKQNLL